MENISFDLMEHSELSANAKPFVPGVSYSSTLSPPAQTSNWQQDSPQYQKPSGNDGMSYYYTPFSPPAPLASHRNTRQHRVMALRDMNIDQLETPHTVTRNTDKMMLKQHRRPPRHPNILEKSNQSRANAEFIRQHYHSPPSSIAPGLSSYLSSVPVDLSRYSLFTHH